MAQPRVRFAQTEDLDAFVRVWNQVWPTLAILAEELRHEDETLEEKYREYRWVAEVDGQTVGIAKAYRHPGNYHLGKWHVGVAVLPAFRGRGFGSALYEAMKSVTHNPDLVHLTSFVREGEADSLRFALARDYEETNRDCESTLALDEVDLGSLPAVRDDLELRTLAEMDSPEFRVAFHELFESVRIDVPRLEPPVRLEYAFFETHVLLSPSLLREGSLVALVDGQLAGFTLLYRGANEGWIDQSLTAVTREFRRRGVASTMKVATVRWAIGAGYRVIRTDNDSRNVGMWAINESLGFRRGPALIALRTKLLEVSQP